MFFLTLSTMASARVELDRNRVASWANPTFETALKQRRFSGLGIVVVQDGKVVFQKSYGYADYQTKAPIDPSRTQFRIGSSTKTFTATAIAQLVDRGLIKFLDDPANRYLKRVQLPNWQQKEITLWNLLTHRPGFEAKDFGLGHDEDVDVPVSPEIIKERMPRIVREPGTLSVYSNFGTAILGVIVEDITGQTLDDYFRNDIFQPLGMTNSVLAYSHKPTADVGRTTTFDQNGNEEQLVHVGIHPFMAGAGGINATLDDMAKYMIAHLDAGRTSRNPILPPHLFDLMHETKVRNQAGVSGFGMLFFTETWNGERIVGHGGQMPGYQTYMVLFPDSNAGIFISDFAESPVVNEWDRFAHRFIGSRGAPVGADAPQFPLSGYNFREMIYNEFLGTFEPRRSAVVTDNLDDFVGKYENGLRNFTQAQSALILRSRPFTVKKGDESGLFIGGVGPYEQVAPDVFWLASRGDDPFVSAPERFLYAFLRGENGKVTSMTTSLSLAVFEKRNGVFAIHRTQYSILFWALIIVATGFLAAFWPRSSQGAMPKWLSGALAAIMIGLFVMSIELTGLGRGGNPFPELTLGRSWQLKIIVLLTNVTSILAVTLAVLSYLSWRHSYYGNGLVATIARLHLTVIALASCVMIPIFIANHLIGFQVP